MLCVMASLERRDDHPVTRSSSTQAQARLLIEDESAVPGLQHQNTFYESRAALPDA